jgi:VIT1/CCC1 family predicted Fe2+/Mn2+ transporter
MRAEQHFGRRTSWLRAAVLGADDGIVSTASLMIGVAASNAPRGAVLTAGIAGLVAGAMSMAVGEYVSVSSQLDAERADLSREAQELDEDPEGEKTELALIYQRRGLSPALAKAVAEELSAGDRLAAHARDELGFDQSNLAQPNQAAWASAASFAAGAAVPVLAAVLAPRIELVSIIALAALVALLALGAWGARLGGAAPLKASLRVAIGGGLAMVVTDIIGRLAGTVAL